MNPQPKKKTIRDKAYREWLRSQPCVLCGAYATPSMDVVAAHASGGGIGIKAGDDTAIPLCTSCHSTEHLGPATFAAMIEVQTGQTREWRERYYWGKYHGM